MVRLADPSGLWWALLAVPVVMLHMLKPRRPRLVVSSTLLWRTVERPVTSASPWRMVPLSWLLLLQLLVVGLLAVAIADPVRVEETRLAGHTVFLIDGSGSMLALDGDPDRITDARARAVEVRRGLPSDGVASVIEVGPQPRVLLSASGDADAFDEAVATVRATSGRADFASAFALAEGLETANAPIGFVLVSDGGLSEEEQRLLPLGTTYEQVGSGVTNRAVVDLDVEARPAELRVRVTVANRGGPAATQTLRLDVDGRTRERVELHLAAGQTLVHETTLSAGDRVDAFLEGEDLLAADNRRVAVSRRRQPIRVRVAGEPDPFLDALLSAIDGLVLISDGSRGVGTTDSMPTSGATADGDRGSGTGTTASEPTPAAAAAGEHLSPDLTIYNRIAVPAAPLTPFLAIRPPGGIPGVEAIGEAEAPQLTLVRSDDPLLRGIDLSSLAVASAQRVRSETAEALLGAESAPLLLRGRADGVRFAYLTFGLSDSNLPLLLAFPLLGDRLLAELAGAVLPPSSIDVGEALAVPSRAGGVVTDPAGAVVEVPPGSPGIMAERSGLWSVVVPGRPEMLTAVNPAAAESVLTPVPGLPTERRPLRPGESPPSSSSSLRPWVLGVAIIAVVAEFLFARRRVGVGPRQWKTASAVRALAICVLLGALLDIGFDRDTGSVAVVFVVDASDSLGARGRGEAVEFVRDALADQPDGSRAGVVMFGGDARIEALLQSRPPLVRPSVRIDPSRSDLAAALRLGGAVLPADARRRVVLISDGRATGGNAVQDAARLRGRGIAVDTALVDIPGASDVAVAAVRAPARVSVGEAIPIEVELQSTLEGPAVVTLSVNGEVVSAQRLHLVAGTQSTTFTDMVAGDVAAGDVAAGDVAAGDMTAGHAVGDGGLRRYRVDVDSDADRVAQNNTGFAAVDTGGPPRVLIVEGAAGNGTGLAAALEAGGLRVRTVPIAGIPQLDELLSYSSVLLTDVSERQLSVRQVGILGSAVREGGRGLLTIGGDRSYGLGGYYNSELERLLPVVSEILDPERRQTVAEVLAIDISGSMGACHCSDGQFASNRIDGGVNKTDISRAAAARTIAALGANDEIGVLAFDVEDRWVIDLQKLPAQDVVNRGLASLTPDGGTDPSASLDTAAEALRDSNAALKHVILFTDGFTSQESLKGLTDDASRLAADGITVSVVATGEGASDELEAVAVAGRGRFYPGRDLQRVPEMIMDEAVLASRDFINEGEFFPVVSSSVSVVGGLTESPPLLGYVATTAKPRASTLLEIGPDGDPLLARWQVGLGTVTSWTSDASERWSHRWADWDGYTGFWSRVVRDTFPSLSDGVTAVVKEGILRVRVEADGGFGDGAAGVAHVTDPVLAGWEVPLSRVAVDVFVGELPVDEAGIYVVGASVVAADGSAVEGTALTSQSYGREYEPGTPDKALLARIADAGAGRNGIIPSMAFDTDGLIAGRSRVDLAHWLLPTAALVFTTAVLLSRFTLAPSLAVSSGLQRTGSISGPGTRMQAMSLAVSSGLQRTGARRIGALRDNARWRAGARRWDLMRESMRRPWMRQRDQGRSIQTETVSSEQATSTAEQDSLLLVELAEADESPQDDTLSALLERTRDRRRGEQT